MGNEQGSAARDSVRGLPPTDHVARVLLNRGARDQAIALLEAAIRRDPGERACAALLNAVKARPDASVYGPDLELTPGLVETYMRRGMMVEALAVLEGGGVGPTEGGGSRIPALRELLAPVPADASPDLREADRQLRSGGAAVALTMLDQRLKAGLELPYWAQRRRDLLSTLLLEAAESAPESSSPVSAQTDFGRSLNEPMERRDMAGAVAAAQQFVARNPENQRARTGLSALERLVAAMSAVAGEDGPGVMRTQPMQPHHVALFQLRMGNLETAERLFRRIVIEEPNHGVARGLLDDIQMLRAAIEGGANASGAHPSIDPLSQTWATEGLRRSEIPVAAGFGPSDRTSNAPMQPSLTDDVPRSDSAFVPEPAEAADLFEESTREVQISVPSAARRVPTADLLKKNAPKKEQWSGYGSAPDPAEWEEEVSTAIGSPDKQAELLLKQGYVSHAIRIYEQLVRTFPGKGEYQLRLAEIRALNQPQNSVPAPSLHPSSQPGAGPSSVPAQPHGATLDAVSLLPPSQADPDIGKAETWAVPDPSVPDGGMGDIRPSGPQLISHRPPQASFAPPERDPVTVADAAPFSGHPAPFSEHPATPSPSAVPPRKKPVLELADWDEQPTTVAEAHPPVHVIPRPAGGAPLAAAGDAVMVRQIIFVSG